MYPLNTLLIGCTDVLSDLRRELTNLSVAIEGEYPDARSCLTFVLTNPADKRLLIFYPKSAAEIIQLERLNESVVGQPILALVDPPSDPSLMVRAMRAGAAQVVRLPLQTERFPRGNDANRHPVWTLGRPESGDYGLVGHRR